MWIRNELSSLAEVSLYSYTHLGMWVKGKKKLTLDQAKKVQRRSRSTVLTHSMEKSPSWEANGPQMVKKFPAFYGTRRFITAFTNARYLSLSWASSVQSISPHPTSWRPILILFSHLRLSLSSSLFPSGFPTKTLYTPLLCPIPRPSHSS